MDDPVTAETDYSQSICYVETADRNRLMKQKDDLFFVYDSVVMPSSLEDERFDDHVDIYAQICRSSRYNSTMPGSVYLSFEYAEKLDVEDHGRLQEDDELYSEILGVEEFATFETLLKPFREEDDQFVLVNQEQVDMMSRHYSYILSRIVDDVPKGFKGERPLKISSKNWEY